MLILWEICTKLGEVMFSCDEVAQLPRVFPGTFSLLCAGFGFWFFCWFFFSLMGNVGMKWQGLSEKG